MESPLSVHSIEWVGGDQADLGDAIHFIIAAQEFGTHPVFVLHESWVVARFCGESHRRKIFLKQCHVIMDAVPVEVAGGVQPALPGG